MHHFVKAGEEQMRLPDFAHGNTAHDQYKKRPQDRKSLILDELQH